MEKTREEARVLIGLAFGKVSMCWEPRPTGEFDSSLAVETLNQLLNALYGEAK